MLHSFKSVQTTVPLSRSRYTWGLRQRMGGAEQAQRTEQSNARGTAYSNELAAVQGWGGAGLEEGTKEKREEWDIQAINKSTGQMSSVNHLSKLKLMWYFKVHLWMINLSRISVLNRFELWSTLKKKFI